MSRNHPKRPRTDRLSFAAYDRPLHPELFETRQLHRFDRDGCRLALHLTDAGHVLQWRRGDVALAEMLDGRLAELSERNQLFAHRIGQERGESCRLAADISYRTCFQLERLPATVFSHVHAELRCDGDRDGLVRLFEPNDRLGLAPMSFVDLQHRTGSFVVHVYHTFPDELCIFKSQTLIEIDR